MNFSRLAEGNIASVFFAIYADVSRLVEGRSSSVSVSYVEVSRLVEWRSASVLDIYATVRRLADGRSSSFLLFTRLLVYSWGFYTLGEVTLYGAIW